MTGWKLGDPTRIGDTIFPHAFRVRAARLRSTPHRLRVPPWILRRIVRFLFLKFWPTVTTGLCGGFCPLGADGPGPQFALLAPNSFLLLYSISWLSITSTMTRPRAMSLFASAFSKRHDGNGCRPCTDAAGHVPGQFTGAAIDIPLFAGDMQVPVLGGNVATPIAALSLLLYVRRRTVTVRSLM